MLDPERSEGAKAYQPIAIVGIGCRFPGEITSPRTFWELLIEGRDGTREIPPDRWSLEKYYDQDAKQIAKIYAKRGGFLDDVSGFDPQFFGISPREAAYVDPQHRLLLETTWEAFEDGGIAPAAWAGRRVGVFVGLFTHDYENIHMRTSERGLYGPHSATGMSTTIAANRISHAFDFKGPSMVIDTACSSSLVAVHLACRSLHEGETDLAVAGGVNLQLTPEMTMSLCKASMLAPDGRCKSFDARANGYARADGAGMVVLKPLAKALADGDAIYAVIRGSAVNQDGRTKGITVPNGASQQQVMQDALACAGVMPSEISYVEAHGTGTPVGDPIEANALGGVLKSGSPDRTPCVIGSVKSNFGHTESAAGIAGLIKVALMQRHGRIPPNLHFETPNPDIPFDDLCLRVPTSLEEWPADADGRRMAGINSFGFGGTNAHVIVANAPEERKTAKGTGTANRALLTCLSARSDEALRANARQYSDFLRTHLDPDASIDAVAAHLALGREHHPVRLTAAGRDRHEIADLLDAFVAGHRRPGLATGTAASTKASGIVFVCSGMGQQWWAMGRGLLESEPVFAAKIADLDGLFGRLNGGWSLREILTASEASTQIDRTDYAQPAIFSLQVALAALWGSWGVRPDMVVGHSIGEVAAAHISGALSLEDAVKVCFHRSRLQAGLAGRGGMLAVGMSASSLQQRIGGMEGLVSIAAVNSSDSTTLAGDIAALERLAVELECDKIFARLLNVEVPYHSPVMDEIGAPFKAALRGLSPRVTDVPLISTVTGKEIDGSTLDAAYWNRNIRKPVLFDRAMRTLMDLQGRVFIEIGAHPVLASSIGECLAAEGVQGTAIASLRRKQDDATTFLGAVGQLHCRGYPLDFERQFEKPSERMDLPTYPWQRTTFWTETPESRKIRTGLAAEGVRPDHPLLGERLSSPQPAWSIEVNPQQPRYLQDHRVQGPVVFPGAGFIEMALAAADETTPANGPVAVERISIEAPLVLAAGSQTRLQFSIGADRQFQIHSLARQEGEQRWTRHVSGFLAEPAQSREAPFLDGTILHDRLPDALDQAEIYRRLVILGLQYGPQFRLLEAAWTGENEALGRIVATPEVEAELGKYKVHPALLDAAFQLLATLPGEATYLPVGAARVEVHRPGVSAAWAYARKVSQTRTRIVANISLADEEGRILAEVSGLACQLFDDAKPGARAKSGSFLYDRVWIAAELAGVSRQRRANFIPAPQILAPLLQELHNRRNSKGQHGKFVGQASPALDALATAYFIEALTRLGWDRLEFGQFTAAELSQELGVSPRHFRMVARMLELLAQSGHVAREDAHWRLCEMPSAATAEAQWQSLVLAHPECHAELNLMHRSGSRLVEFLRDEEEPLSALFPSGSPIAEHVYSDSPTFGPYNRIIADAVAEIVQQLPEGETLRILEVGAGTGGLASLLLPLLPAERTDYVFTDVSQNFLNQAKDRFRAFPFVRYELLDVEEEPRGQGFVEESFDLIIICDAVHATADLRATLGSLQGLLVPGGMLALMEMTAPPCWCDLVFGLLPGWWAFSDTDLRPGHATLPASAWLSVLAQCGYDACAVISDQTTDDQIGDDRGSLHSVILARKPDDAVQLNSRGDSPLQRQAGLDPNTPIILLADMHGVADALADKLRSIGHEVTVSEPGKPDMVEVNGPPQQLLAAAAGDNTIAPVVVDMRGLAAPNSTADGDSPSIAGMVACENLQEVVRVLTGRTWQGKPDLWVVTNGTETVGGVTKLALEQTPVRGFARVVTNEHAELNTYLVDLSPECGEMELAALAQEIAARSGEDEIALRGSRRFVNRVIAHRNPRDTDGNATAFRVSREKQSSLDGLVFREVAAALPGPGQVQVRICAAGLNFKDFARHAGLVDTASDGLGMEGAGIVTAVGEGVEQWAPGDPVVGLFDGSLSNPVNTDARVLVRKPANLSFEDAAGIPIIYLSAYQALKKQARLAAGETVLIHTAAGGLGLAALQVARSLGAKVLATAGNEEKRNYLRACGVGYVGDSRSGAFAEEIMQQTAGKGVDVVFNTLPAAMNQHNIRLLPPGSGRLVDLRNMHYGAQLDYSALQKGILFSAFDLNVIAEADPEYISGLLGEIVPLFESGVLRPVPYRRTPLERISETVRSFRKAAHIGKFVVSVADGAVDMVPAAGDMPLRGDASYLVSGGLSGFGLSTAHWFARNGARHLVLVGRRGAATPEAAAALVGLRAAGVEVHAVVGDVADPKQMQALMIRFGREWPALRGIVHSAMVLRDGPILDMTADQIRSVLAPKVDGAWNLHRFSLDQPLDFFICYSSMSAVLGNRHQANYAAANEYLEALARHRRADGRPALAIGWGAIDAAGHVARDEKIQDVFVRQGVFDLDLDLAWAAITHGLRTGAANLYAAALDWSTIKQFSRAVSASPRFSLLQAGPAGQKSDKDAQVAAWSDLDTSATPEERYQHLQKILIREISGVLGTDPQNLDMNRQLENLGFDSLMAVELIVAIERATGLGFSRMSLLRADVTTAQLIAEVAGILGGKSIQPAAEEPDEDTTGAVGRHDIEIENLSDREVDVLLRELATEELGDG